MKKISETIVFFGSGPVAAKSLELLAESLHIEAVVTKPRPIHHKGSVPVIDIAEHLGLKLYLVENRDELNTLIRETTFESKLGILIDFGIIVSQAVINTFALGIVNSHFSLLPEWRGADPITFALLSGQQQTGVSLMLLTAGMDEGPIIAQAPFALDSSITNPELTAALIQLSHTLLENTLPGYIAGQIKPTPQDQTKTVTYSRKLNKEDGILDWQKPADQLAREVRAYNGWPGSRAKLNSLEITVLGAHAVDAQGIPGQTAILDKIPVIYCGDKALGLDRLKPAGKKEMTGQAFLAGYRDAFLSN